MQCLAPALRFSFLPTILILTAMKRPWLFLLISCFVFSCGSGEQTPRTAKGKSLKKAAIWLWEQQEEDGAWRSQVHGILKSGQAFTPYILWALSQVPDSILPFRQEQMDRGIDFIVKSSNQEGAMGLADPDILEYPNYATAFALQVLIERGGEEHWDLQQKMRSYLLSQQLNQSREIPFSDPIFGGWNFGEQYVTPQNPGHVDLSVSRRVLQALRRSNYQGKEVFADAHHFLSFLQKRPRDGRLQPDPDSLKGSISIYDGGFYYSPNLGATNKAKQYKQGDTLYYRSYATATCDGVLALLACGASPDDEPVQSALKWLLDHPDLHFPDGIPKEDPDQWHRVMVYYHIAVRAQVYAELQPAIPWKEDISGFLLERQQENGSFFNPEGARNKEDDPYLATAFSILALSACL